MGIVLMIIDILTAVVAVLPRVVEFIEKILELRSQELSEAVVSGADEQTLNNLKRDIRESTISAVNEEFRGSPTVIPEPVTRIIYEYLVLSKFGDTKKYADKLEMAIKKGFMDGKHAKDAKEQVAEVKKAYPQLFGSNR